MLKKTERIAYLDGLRGVAALFVFFHHFGTAFLPFIQFRDPALIHLKIEELIVKTPLFIFFDGTLMVFIFFVLSGLVLSRIADNFLTNNRNIVPYLIKRYIRLSIPVVFSLVIAYLLISGGYINHIAASEISKSTMWLGSYYNFVPNLSDSIYQGFIGSFLYNQWSYNNVIWTIYFEFIGSIIVLISVPIMKNYSSIKYGILLVLLIIFKDTPIFAFYLGTVLYYIHKQLTKPFSKITLIVVFLVAYIFWDYINVGFLSRIFVGSTLIKDNSIPEIFFIKSLVSFAIILLILNSNFLKTFLQNKIFIFLGRISFSLYLVHAILLITVGSRVFVLVYHVFENRYFPTLIASLIIDLILVLMISIGFNKIIDENAIKISNSIFKYIRNKLVDK